MDWSIALRARVGQSQAIALLASRFHSMWNGRGIELDFDTDLRTASTSLLANTELTNHFAVAVSINLF